MKVLYLTTIIYAIMLLVFLHVANISWTSPKGIMIYFIGMILYLILSGLDMVFGDKKIF
jgi:hypothetical protein